MRISKTLSLILGLICSLIKHCHSLRRSPRCKSSFLFDRSRSDNDEVYSRAWETPCSPKVRELCSKNVTLSYFSMEPFSNGDELNKTIWPRSGLIQQVLSVAIAECCGSCINITYNKVNNRTQLIAINTREESDILLPIFSQGREFQLNSTIPAMNIPVIHLSSAMFITKSSISAKLFAKEILSAIIDIWPLLGVAILLAYAAGVVIWITDTWWNKEHFPRRFVTGAFEGFWWAFISMTTVGYGDRVPKSVLGRLFSVLWILCGMTICGLLTAALTTAIVVVAARQSPSINKGVIGILRDRTFEKSILMKGNAEKIYLDSIKDISQAVVQGTVDGMLLDIYTAKYSSQLINEDLYVDSIIQDLDLSYLGISIYEEDLYSLIAEYIEFHKDYIKDFIFDTFQSMEELERTDIASNLIFTTKSGMFEPVVYVCVFILGMSLLIGGIYEVYQYRKRKRLHIRRKETVVTLRTLKKQECLLQDELMFVLNRWDKYLLGMIKAYTIEGIFTKSSTTFPNVVVKISPYKREKDYSADSFVIEEGSEDSPSPKESGGVMKRRPRSGRQNKVSPTPDTPDDSVCTEDGPVNKKGYINFKDSDNNKKPLIASKVKKKRQLAKKKKTKMKTPLSGEPYDIYGTINGHAQMNGGFERDRLPYTRRLPPLSKAEDIV